jgi:NAD(P)-dependent dehydrogenase (short-subunit alcohol dehydrogenase family)
VLGKVFFFNGAKCTIKKNMKGKFVFITGGNSGIGEITALELAKRGATIIIACRD